MSDIDFIKKHITDDICNFRSESDVVFFIAHATFLENGFRLAKVNAQNTTIVTQEWNNQTDSFHFSYKHDSSSLTFVLKGLSVVDSLLFIASTEEDKKLFKLDFKPSKLVCQNFKSFPISKKEDFNKNIFENLAELREFKTLLKTELIQKLAPNLKGTDTVAAETDSTRVEPTSSANNYNPQPFHGIPANRQPSNNFNPQYGNPYSIGDADLDPFAAAPGMSPFGRFTPGSGNGMTVGPGHSMFNQPGYNPESHPRYPDSHIPPESVPPNARFDPVGPFAPRPAFPGSRGSGRVSQFSGEPDNDLEPFNPADH
ncbi:hypothetical protein HK099_001496, partial [Clydaea vesicula]